MPTTPLLGLEYIALGSQTSRPILNGDLDLIDAAVGAPSVVTAVAYEDLDKGDLVNLHNFSGVVKARLADKDTADMGAVAHGVCLADVVTGATAVVRVAPGPVTRTGHGLTLGARLYLSTGGAWTETAPSGTGDTVQELGLVLTANSILFLGYGLPYML